MRTPIPTGTANAQRDVRSISTAKAMKIPPSKWKNDWHDLGK